MTAPPDLAAIRARASYCALVLGGGHRLTLVESEQAHADRAALLDGLVMANMKSDQEMLRTKACEHIAEGDEGWEALRNMCPSTVAVAALRDRLDRLARDLHASAPSGYKCADCTMDREPCPDCYEAAWKKRHPNTLRIRPDRLDAVTVEEVADVIRAHATPQRWQLWSPDRAAAAVLALLRERVTSSPEP